MGRRSGLEALKAAIKFEKDGRKFFLDANKKTKQKYGQLMFRSIADAELEHIKRIREVYDSLIKTREWPDRPALFTKKSPLKNVFEEAREKLDQNVKVETNDIEAAKMAREYEEKGSASVRIWPTGRGFLSKRSSISNWPMRRGDISLFSGICRNTTSTRFTGIQIRRGSIGTGHRRGCR